MKLLPALVLIATACAVKSTPALAYSNEDKVFRCELQPRNETEAHLPPSDFPGHDQAWRSYEIKIPGSSKSVLLVRFTGLPNTHVFLADREVEIEGKALQSFRLVGDSVGGIPADHILAPWWFAGTHENPQAVVSSNIGELGIELDYRCIQKS